MLSSLSPRASNAAASSADILKSLGVVGRLVVSAVDAVVATTAAGGELTEGSFAGAAGRAASTGSTAGAAGRAASTGSTAGAAGRAASTGSTAGAAGRGASTGSTAGAAGRAASTGTGSICGAPSIQEPTPQTAALPIANPLLNALSENSLMTPTVAVTGSAARFLCMTTLIPVATTIPVAAIQKRASGKARCATTASDNAGFGERATPAMAGG